MTDSPSIVPVHFHGDGRRSLYRYLNDLGGGGAKQVYVVDIRPGITTAWHGHARQTDWWVVLDGILQVGVAPIPGPAFAQDYGTQVERPHEFWLDAGNPQILQIPPGNWHGYHNAGPGMVRLLNMTSEGYDAQAPDEMRMDPDFWPNFWGHVEMK